MIRAGQLRHPIRFLEKSKETSDTGAIIDILSVIYSTRCQMLKSVGNQNIQAYEDTDTYDITIKLRTYKKITEDMLVELNGYKYNIVHKYDDLQENSTTLKIRRIDI